MARILVIDDDRVQRLVATQALTRGGHEVLEARDGVEGLDRARALLPDLIVCDVIMPGLNGYQFVTALRQEEGIAGIPVIMLTSMAERTHMRLGMNAGADDYLTKPFSFQELTDAVDALLAKRRALHEGLVNSMNDSFITALEEQRESLAADYERQLVEALGARWEEGGAQQVKFEHAIVLKAMIAQALQHVATGKDAAAQVRKVYDATRDALHLFNPAYLLPAGSDVVAVYVDEADSVRVRAYIRAVRAALNLQKGLANLGGLTATIGLHCGPVTVMRVDDPLHGGPASSLATGSAMHELDAVCEAARSSHWAVAASASLVGEMAGKVVTGRSTQAAAPGEGNPIDVMEVLSLK
ncbi:MAG TPA: response regulator [Ramlibacter sp.]